MEAKDCVPGTKVKIPTKKSTGDTLEESLQRFALNQDHLFIVATPLGAHYVEVANKYPSTSADFYLPSDLEPYDEVLSQDYKLLQEEDNKTRKEIIWEAKESSLVAEVDPIIPSHYNSTTITTFQVVKDWNLDFFLGNVVKYIQRHNRKGKPVEDLKKALTYLQTHITNLENGTAN